MLQPVLNDYFSRYIPPELPLESGIRREMLPHKTDLFLPVAGTDSLKNPPGVNAAQLLLTEKQLLCPKAHHQKRQIQHQLKQGHILIDNPYIIP